jgi:peptidoglycan/xylan/chitin deacetylase (PgdA/CDA1 family)
MPPPRDPVPRAHSAFHWLGGILLLGLIAAGVLAAGMKLWEDVDIQSLTRTSALAESGPVPTALEPNPPASLPQPYRAVLYHSTESAAFFADSAYYPDLLIRWERLITETGGEVNRISGVQDIESLDSQTVLVAPAPVCLSAEEVTALREHAERGGQLVVSWAAGARDSACEWLGWDAAVEITGAVEIRDLESREALYFTVPSGLPLSSGFDPGTRVELRHEAQLAATTRGARVYWSDWSLNPDPAERASDVNAAVLTDWTEQGGRVVWFGFRLDQGARPLDEERIQRLVRNGLRWAAGIPVAAVEPWPGGNRSALLVSQDVEERFENSMALVDIAQAKRVPITFFVVSQLVLDFPNLADSLKSVGEIGSHTSDHAVVVGLSYRDQRPKLTRSWSELRRWTGDQVFGLHPPEESFDENTLRAWREAGGTYLIAINDARTASPEVFETLAGQVVLLPRIVKDDYNVFVQESALRSKYLGEAYLEGMAKVRALGGLAVLSIRTQVGGEPARVKILGEVVDSARAQGQWWLATGREVADWWLARRSAQVELANRSEGQIVVRVVARQADLSGAWVSVYLPGSPTDWTPTVDDRQVRYAEFDWGLRVPVADLVAGEETEIVLFRR